VKRLIPLLAVALAVPVSAHAATPIPDPDRTQGIPEFDGAAATPHPIRAPLPPRHPHMAPNERSNLHVDAFQTDTNVLTGPLGKDPSVISTFYSADCGSVTFDSHGHIVTVCVGLTGPTLRMLDAKTLDEVASFSLPPRQPGAPGGNIFQDFAGGGYFYLDDADRAVIPTTTRHLLVVKANESGFAQEKDIDLTSVVPQGDKIISALPDWSGLIWVASVDGVVATVDLASGRIKSLDTKEHNGNSFAVGDENETYIVTNAALYRMEAGADGTPQVVWREAYDNIGQQKPGQAQAGSGTTPTVMDGGLVAITDNADPMNVVVYKKGRTVSGPRQVCKQPVFKQGASSSDNSLNVAGRSIVVENNYGYTGPDSVQGEKTTTPGIERIDLDADGEGCKTVWHSDETSPSVVTKISLGSGLVYAYTNPPNQPNGGDGWYLTGIDFRTGKTAFRRLTGEGIGFNNNYAPVTIGPDGTAYVGTLGGLVAVRDASPPPQNLAPTNVRMDNRVNGPKPRVSLRVKRLRGSRVRVTVVGAERRFVKRADFKLGNRKQGTDKRSPFARTMRIATTRKQTIRAILQMDDGARAIVKRTLRPRRR
jgi:hypothetical protein